MNDNQSNYSWREWSKYVLLTLERFEKLIEDSRGNISCIKEDLKTIKSEIETIHDELEQKATKSDLKFIDYKVALITGAITFVATLFAVYLFNLIMGKP